ncbi:hypothetical protein GCM10009744_48140 [Kribbella alba]|uniref:Uncharacterized protein n=1 Tax=Kribbella alba TaxID=190197 RepID=A0ABN2FKI3_9ACTN
MSNGLRPYTLFYCYRNPLASSSHRIAGENQPVQSGYFPAIVTTSCWIAFSRRAALLLRRDRLSLRCEALDARRPVRAPMRKQFSNFARFDVMRALAARVSSNN